MPFGVLPREGLDVVRFGERREAVRARFGEFELVQRGAGCRPVDYHRGSTMFLEYDQADRLVFIELVPPAEVVVAGVPLMARNLRDVVADLAAQGIHGAADDSGVEFAEFGLGLFSRWPEEDDATVEGVAVFAPGYYDQGGSSPG